MKHSAVKVAMRKKASIRSILIRAAESFIAFSWISAIVPIAHFRLVGIGALYFALITASFTLAGLLYNRARAFSKGRLRIRSFVAAERAMEGAFHLLVAAALGAGLYALFSAQGFVPLENSTQLPRKHLMLLAFGVPMFMSLDGIVALRLAIQVVGVDLFGKRSLLQLRRQIRNDIDEKA
jgi:hypothetical protein